MEKIRMGMVGGGQGAFIGAVHRMAALLDGNIELVCGAFSSSKDKSVASGLSLGLDENRCYGSYQEMMLAEKDLPEKERMEAVIVVTPNHLHFDVSKVALENGFHVICDKPATFDLAQAVALKDVIKNSQRLYGLTHTYTGYPLVKKAKELVEQGVLGKVTKVIAEYHQGWLATKDAESSKQAAWRIDPKQAGVSCCMGDIGVHAANLAEYVTGADITEICSDLNTTVDGRVLDDDGLVILKFANQSKGYLSASQICAGEENNLSLRVYGTQASLSWEQQSPNSLWVRTNEGPTQEYRTAVGESSPYVAANIRTPAGHPEGYIEAFANIYQNFVKQIQSYRAGDISDVLEANQAFDVPGIDEAIQGMNFIESVVKASQSNDKWHKL